MNQGWTYCDRITQKSANVTLLDYYTQRYHHSTRQQWQGRIEAGQVRINGQPARPNTLLEAGQKLTYHRSPWQEPAAPLDFHICYQDSDIWVVNKPSGLPVLPGANFLEHTLLWQVRQQDSTAYPVHRLGRGTSGLVLFARTPVARAHLSQQMRSHQVTKTYRAIVGGTTIPAEFTIDQPIGRCPHPTRGYVYGAVDDTDSDGLWAKSQGQVRQYMDDRTEVKVTITTGRPHQIRIHLAALGHPLLGDPLYSVGGRPRPDAVPGDCGYFLHAWQLSFRQPTTGKQLTIQQDPPWDSDAHLRS